MKITSVHECEADRIVGERLLRALMAHLRGESRVVRLVQVASVAPEDARRANNPCRRSFWPK